MAKGKALCDNCGGEQYSLDCPHPRNKAKINKSKEECAARRGGGKTEVDRAVDAVADEEVTAISGARAMIMGMGIGMIM